MKILRRINQFTVLLAAYVSALVAYSVPFGWAGPAILLAAMFCRKVQKYSAYGTAAWASIHQLGHMLEGPGLIVGHIAGRPSRIAGLKALFSRRRTARQAVERFLQSCQGKFSGNKQESLVRLTQAVHCTIVAPTGVGKNVSCITPFLMTCEESCVVIDPKGESFNLTSETRRRMGHEIARLDPFSVCGPGSDSLNVLDFIDPESPTANDECSALAKAMVIRTGEEKDPFWANMAEAFIGGFTGAIVAFAEGSDKNLQSVRTLLTNPQKMQKAIEMMCASDKWQGMLSRRGHFLTNSRDKELGSTLTTTNSHMSFLDTIPIANITRNSSFDPAHLRTGKMTCYIVLPPEHMRTQSSWLRMIISSLMLSVIRGGLQEKNKVHYVIDEAKLLGRMDLLSEMLTIGRGYGIRMQLYYQDCGQILECWPNGGDQTLLANSTLIAFGVNDQKTAELVSAKLGKHTIIVSSGGTTKGDSRSSSQQGGSSSYSSGANSNWSQVARELLRPEEITQLSPRTAITFTPGVPPIATTLIRYYEKSFGKDREMGTFRAAVETICLLVAVAFVAALLTMAVFNPAR